MPVVGRKPKPEGQKVNRVPPTHEWTEVVDERYAGERPPLPGRMPKRTREWWEAVSTMPHCVLWSAEDWQFALDTAAVHAAFARGDMNRAGELRIREKHLGTTWDARRDLRIRYVEAKQEPEQGTPPEVADFEAERRRRLMGAG